jgi:hypothetical protein
MKWFHNILVLNRFLPDAVDSAVGRAHFAVHQVLDDRLAAARQLVADKGLRGDVVVDSMENDVSSCMGQDMPWLLLRWSDSCTVLVSELW